MHSTPIFILSGFLGSGKTTLLLRLLQETNARGLRPAVLMNELGKLDVDGNLLRQQMPELSLEKLLDGCICCDKKSEIAGSVEILLRQAPDILIIELTGVANPEEIADSLTEPQLIGRVHLKLVATVLDAEHVLDYNSIFATDRQLVHTLRRQIEVAGLLVVNKIDLVSEAKLRKIDKILKSLNAGAISVHAFQSQFDMDPLFQGIESNPENRPSPASKFKILKDRHDVYQVHESRYEHRSFSRLQTLSLPADRTFPQERIERFLKKWQTRLYRAKGYLSISGKKEIQLMQLAGKRIRWQSSNYSGPSYLVLIGIDLDTEQMTAEWEQL